MFVYVRRRSFLICECCGLKHRDRHGCQAETACAQFCTWELAGIELCVLGRWATLVWTWDLSLHRLLDDTICRRTAQLIAVPSLIHGCPLENGVPDSTCIFSQRTNQAFACNLLDWTFTAPQNSTQHYKSTVCFGLHLVNVVVCPGQVVEYDDTEVWVVMDPFQCRLPWVTGVYKIFVTGGHAKVAHLWHKFHQKFLK